MEFVRHVENRVSALGANKHFDSRTPYVQPRMWLQFQFGKGLQPMLLIAEKDNGRTLDIHPGDSIRIILPENATTGYSWAIDHYDEEFIEALKTQQHYMANAIGSAGEAVFICKGKKIGTGEIRLKYWRHWEGELSVTNRFRIRLHVQP